MYTFTILATLFITCRIILLAPCSAVNNDGMEFANLANVLFPRRCFSFVLYSFAARSSNKKTLRNGKTYNGHSINDVVVYIRILCSYPLAAQSRLASPDLTTLMRTSTFLFALAIVLTS